MHSLDGSSGGGQLLRSAVSLSALSGEPFRMTGIRARRSNPGLRPQHLAAVHAVARVCNAELYGNSVGSEALTFRPKGIDGGRFSIDVETAGSIVLVFDALLPLAVTLDKPLFVTVTGGTDVRWSPTIDYFREVKLPLCRGFGLLAGVEISRTGYYPAGSGEATLWVAPSSLSEIDLSKRGEFTGIRIYSKASTSLVEQNVAERQAETARERLRSAGYSVLERRTTYAKSNSTGSSLLVRAEYGGPENAVNGGSLAGFDGLGERGVPAEDIAKRVVGAFSAFHDEVGVVDEHMADQLLIFLALAGGHVAIPKITAHIETSLELLSAFGYDVSLVREPNPTLTGE